MIARTCHRLRAPGRGISLIEALVAMAVMAFGMLGVVGLQGTLRGNADMSKQRTEAMRIAQERMEDLRNFSVLATTPGSKAYADKVTFAATAVTGYTTNTTYTVSGTVTPVAGTGTHKTLSVDVSWADRAGTTQNVRIVSAMANIAPQLGASMVAPAQGAGGMREPEGRRRGIPPQAKNFGDGTSGFVPPGNPGGVAWRFDNVTGVITSRCTTVVTDNNLLNPTDLTGCGTQKYQAIWGFISFHTTGVAPTAASIIRPTSPINPPAVVAEIVQTAPATAAVPECFHGTDPATPQLFRGYVCAVPVDDTTTPKLAWAGTLRINAASLAPLALGTAAGQRRVCRFRADPTYALADTARPLGNQNLVLTEGPFACDLGTPQVTWQHQP
ncbi:MAG: hypothetical protein KIT17_08360 [Rubrivivax sp.]|nr:hypothetical protein [Rubrivivax sp.]